MTFDIDIEKNCYDKKKKYFYSAELSNKVFSNCVSLIVEFLIENFFC